MVFLNHALALLVVVAAVGLHEASVWAANEDSGSPPRESDRSVINLVAMALRVLPCAFPLPYGCWCGITIPFPPSGGPIDKWDEMCKVHDYCYVDGQKDIGCNFIDVFIWPYAWDYVDGKLVCSEYNTKCQKFFCECDKKVIDSIKEAVDADGGKCPMNPGCPDR